MPLSETYHIGIAAAIDTALSDQEVQKHGEHHDISPLSSSSLSPDIEHYFDIVSPSVYILPYCIFPPRSTSTHFDDKEKKEEDSMPVFSKSKKESGLGVEVVVGKENMGEKWKKLGKFGKKDKDANKTLLATVDTDSSGEISSPNSSPPPPPKSILDRTSPEHKPQFNPLEFYSTPLKNGSGFTQETLATPPLDADNSMASSFGTLLDTPAQSSHPSPAKDYFPNVESGDKQASFGLGLTGLAKVTFHRLKVKVRKDQRVQHGADRLENLGNIRLKTFGEDGSWAIGPILDEEYERVEGRRENGIFSAELSVYEMMVQLVQTSIRAKAAAENAYLRVQYVKWGEGSYDELEQVVEDTKDYLATVCLFLQFLDDIAVVEGSMSFATLECCIQEIINNTDTAVVTVEAGGTVHNMVGEEFMRRAFVPWKYSEEPKVVPVRSIRDESGFDIHANTAIKGVSVTMEEYLSTLYFFVLHQVQSIANHINPLFSMRPEVMARAVIRVKDPKPVPRIFVDQDGMVIYRGGVYTYIEHAMDAAAKELDLLATEWANLDREIKSSIQGNEMWFGAKDVQKLMDNRVKAFDKVKKECNLAIY